MKPQRVLVVDDEAPLVKLLRSCLRTEGYDVLAALNGADALDVVEREVPDLIILDLMMPVMDGLEFLRRMREWSQTPVLILSGRQSEQEKVECLDLGADDYLAKPFGVNELLARIRAILRRVTPAGEVLDRPAFTTGGLRIDFPKRRVAVDGIDVALTATEYHLLRQLALECGKIFGHAELLGGYGGRSIGTSYSTCTST